MRYLCPWAAFHDWSDEQPDLGGVPPLRYCPQHAKAENPAEGYEVVGRVHDSILLKKKEETKNR